MIISTENNFSLTISVGDDNNGCAPGNASSCPASAKSQCSPNCHATIKVDESANELDFDSPSHLSRLSAGLSAMRARGQLVDVILKTEDQTFPVHRVVLSACSDYFRAMFCCSSSSSSASTTTFREQQQQQVVLAGVSAAGVSHLLDYAYTAKLRLSLLNVHDVLAAASHLQVEPVVQACANYLQAQLDVDNCVDVTTLAETYFLHGLRRKAYKFISENLAAFSAKAELLQRLSANQMEHLLDSNFPVDVPEESVLEMLLNWLDFQKTERMAHAHRLLKKIHFASIHPAHLRSLVHRKFSSNLPRSFLSRIEALSQESIPTSGQQNHLVNSRGMREALVKVGGFAANGVTNRITYYLPHNDQAGVPEVENHQWQLLTSVPHVESCNFGCAVLRNELFVVGGCFNQSLQEEEHIHPFGFRYDPRLNKWSTLAPMTKERCRFSLTAFGQSLYAFGGVSEENGQDNAVMDQQDKGTAEKYDLDTDKWTLLPAMPGPRRSQHAAAKVNLGMNQGSGILISGGIDEDGGALDSMLVYWPNRDTYQTDGPERKLPQPRADHVMMPWRDKVFVCGGWRESDDGERTLVSSVELYDPEKNVWTVETNIPTPRYHAGITMVGGKIFIVGGLKDTNGFKDRATGLVECYDVELGKWLTSDSSSDPESGSPGFPAHPEDAWEHSCASLFVPISREDIQLIDRRGETVLEQQQQRL